MSGVLRITNVLNADLVTFSLVLIVIAIALQNGPGVPSVEDRSTRLPRYLGPPDPTGPFNDELH
jgi:hypothetical protein